VTRRPAAALAAVLAVGLMLAGCGDDDGGDAAAPSSTSTSAATSTSTTTTTTTPPPPEFADEAADEPVALAAQIVATERAIRDAATAPEVVADAGRLQQLAYRRLGAHPEWDETVVGATPDDLREVVDRNVAARRQLRSMHLVLEETLPAWRIEAPQPIDELLGYYREAEAQFGVPWQVLAAVHLVETGLGRIVGLSTAGAQGPMQFLPATWEAYGMGGDVWDERDAILGAANYLAANGAAGGDLDNALHRYNNHDAYVDAVRHYSAVMEAEPLAYRGYHAWEVVYLTVLGDIVLPVGYESTERIPVEEYLARG
jgi:membrane-bound lytic murein transglycosylase B